MCRGISNYSIYFAVLLHAVIYLYLFSYIMFVEVKTLQSLCCFVNNIQRKIKFLCLCLGLPLIITTCTHVYNVYSVAIINMRRK